MKKQILLGITLAALGATAAIAQDQSLQLPPLVGRYQLVDATFSAPPDNPDKKFTRLVRIDTVTGNMWVCDYIYVPANPTQWVSNGRCDPFPAQQDYVINRNVKKQ
jgi:hypothetical protein